MEVWDLLRPSLRRLTVLAVVAIVAALGAVFVEHARAAEYDGRVSVYFAQALGLDTTSNSVDPTADQLTNVLQLPSVEAKAATEAGVPLRVVHDAVVAHTSGSPILDITATGSREQATKAAPALAAAGLEYFAQQGVARAQSLQASATANLASVNAELTTFSARAGVTDVDAAVATATAAVAAAPDGSNQKKFAAANLARLQALQPQYDLLSTEVVGARASVSQAYSAVGAAQGVAKAVELPGNVVTAPVTPASRITAYLRAAVGAVVVVAVLGGAFLALIEVRRRRAVGTGPAAAAITVGGASRAPAAAVEASAGVDPPTEPEPGGPAVLEGDFPILAATAPPPPAPTAPPPPAPPTPAPHPSAPTAAPSRADLSVGPSPVGPDAGVADRYVTQAQRFVRDQRRCADAADQAKEHELQRRALRDALQQVERTEAEPAPANDSVAGEPEPPGTTSAPEQDAVTPAPPRLGGRTRAQIRVLKVVPDAPVDDEAHS